MNEYNVGKDHVTVKFRAKDGTFDVEGFRQIKAAQPTLKWTTGEHEYTRYGFRRLLEERLLDIVQPDVMWVGGLTETLKIAAHASAYDVVVVPHGSGPYSYQFIASQTGPAFCEYVAASPDGRSIMPVFGDLFVGEPVPVNGRLKLPSAPGFGMELADLTMLALLGFEIFVLRLALLAFRGGGSAGRLSWLVFALHLAASAAVAVFALTFRMERLF